MITFCIGSARQKRAYFKAFDGATVLDNTEVLFCASENGKNYFAYGETPFSEFTVREYLTYRTALSGAVTNMTALLSAFGISPYRRMGRLCEAERRCIAFIESGGVADGTVVVNLDGAKCTRRNVKALTALLSVCGTAFVCVTDKRFLKRFGSCRKLVFGKAKCDRRPEFYAAKLLAKRLGAKKVAVF